jgi:hypothetical protein
VTELKKLLVLVAALALVLVFAAPAFANVHEQCGGVNEVDDVTLAFELPIQVQINHALWAEFQTAAGQQKDGLTINVCPGEGSVRDGGFLVIKSNDDFTKTFTWTDLVWDDEVIYGEGPDTIPAADLLVKEGPTPSTMVPVTQGVPIPVAMGEVREPLSVSYAADWTHHAGAYNGTMGITIMQE